MSKRTIGRYTIKKITPRTYSKAVSRYIYYSSDRVNREYKNLFPNWDSFPMLDFLKLPDCHLWVAFRDGAPVGFLLATGFKSFFDRELKILKQQILYATPGTRASYYLLEEFIDFGKSNANHVISSIGTETNIKPRSLERLGFKKFEELFRLEF